MLRKIFTHVAASWPFRTFPLYDRPLTIGMAGGACLMVPMLAPWAPLPQGSLWQAGVSAVAAAGVANMLTEPLRHASVAELCTAMARAERRAWPLNGTQMAAIALKPLPATRFMAQAYAETAAGAAFVFACGLGLAPKALALL